MLKRPTPTVLMSLALLGSVLLGLSKADDSAPPSQRPPYQPAEPFQKFLEALNRAGNPLDHMAAPSIAQLWLTLEVTAYGKPEIPVKQVRDLCVPARNHGIGLRIYTPVAKSTPQDAKLPILIYVHGGGWTLGSIVTYDSLTRMLANKLPAVVVSVDYRLAPEHPFPTGLNDVYLAVVWIARNAQQIGGDPERIVIAGDSSGGNHAAVVSMRARKLKLPIVFQALFYPSTNISTTDTASYREYGEGYWLTRKAVEAFRSFYLPNREHWDNPQASPLLTSSDDLKWSPPTLVLTAGCDPLREEGKAYADRLKACGVTVTHQPENDMIHGFLGLVNTPLYNDASQLAEARLDKAVTVIRDALAPKPGVAPK